MDINKIIKAIREERGMTKKEFSILLGMDNSQYGKTERGDASISTKKLLEILSKLKMTPYDFFYFGEINGLLNNDHREDRDSDGKFLGVGSRLKVFRENLGIDTFRMAQMLLGVINEQGLIEVENGYRQVPPDMIKQMETIFGLDEHWLKYGKGEPIKYRDRLNLAFDDMYSNEERWLVLNTNKALSFIPFVDEVEIPHFCEKHSNLSHIKSISTYAIAKKVIDPENHLAFVNDSWSMFNGEFDSLTMNDVLIGEKNSIEFLKKIFKDKSVQNLLYEKSMFLVILQEDILAATIKSYDDDKKEFTFTFKNPNKKLYPDRQVKEKDVNCIYLIFEVVRSLNKLFSRPDVIIATKEADEDRLAGKPKKNRTVKFKAP